MTPEIKAPARHEFKKFSLTFERVRYTPELEVDLANYMPDEMNGGRILISPLLPFVESEKICNAINTIQKEIVPERAMEELLRRWRHGELVIVTEFETTDKNVVFGMEMDTNTKPVAWYLRNKTKEPNVFKKITRKLGLPELV